MQERSTGRKKGSLALMDRCKEDEEGRKKEGDAIHSLYI
jgi:hypothetical protein